MCASGVPLKDTLTTTDVQRLLGGVCSNTVRRLVDRGLLKCWKIPGSTHRRFERSEVERFLRENGIPKGLDEIRPAQENPPASR